MSKRRVYATVPEPYANVNSLYASVLALKELVEGLTGQRGGAEDQAVMRADLPDRGVVPEYGVWTPTLIPASGAVGAITYDPSFTYGRFYKIGKRVDVFFQVSWSGWTIGSASGLVNIGLLPFRASGDLPVSGYWPGVQIAYGSAGSVPLSGLIAGNNTSINLYYVTTSAGSHTNFTTAQMIAAGHLWGHGNYLTEQ